MLCMWTLFSLRKEIILIKWKKNAYLHATYLIYVYPFKVEDGDGKHIPLFSGVLRRSTDNHPIKGRQSDHIEEDFDL